MPLLPVKLPPGMCHTGTEYQTEGRWYDGSGFRFKDNEVKPINGWQPRISTQPTLTGICRSVLTWQENSGTRWIGLGTNQKLYVQDEAGDISDVTPVGLVTGRPDASQNLGYGGGFYGISAYGTQRPNNSSYLPANVWTLDSWGQDMVGCFDADGKIYEWTLNVATPAAVVANAPTGNQSICVTAEGFLFALGAGGDPRKVQWCDQQNDTLWAPASTNQAGDIDLATQGHLQRGVSLSGGTLLLTDVDAWFAQYIGQPYIYSFNRVGTGCGIVGKQAIASRDARAVWMGKGGFWMWDGQAIQPLDCEVRGKVFDNMNQTQLSKVFAVDFGDQNEVWWFYPSAGSTEVDSYVAWAYGESALQGRNIWTFGDMPRTGGTGRSVYLTPIMTDVNGIVFEHEVGYGYDGGTTPWLASGPIELGNGDTLIEVDRIIPDHSSPSGSLQMTIYGREYPTAAETQVAKTTLVAPTDVRFQAAQIRLRYDMIAIGNDKIGNVRLNARPGNRRR